MSSSRALIRDAVYHLKHSRPSSLAERAIDARVYAAAGPPVFDSILLKTTSVKRVRPPSTLGDERPAKKQRRLAMDSHAAGKPVPEQPPAPSKPTEAEVAWFFSHSNTTVRACRLRPRRLVLFPRSRAAVLDSRRGYEAAAVQFDALIARLWDERVRPLSLDEVLGTARGPSGPLCWLSPVLTRSQANDAVQPNDAQLRRAHAFLGRNVRQRGAARHLQARVALAASFAAEAGTAAFREWRPSDVWAGETAAERECAWRPS